MKSLFLAVALVSLSLVSEVNAFPCNVVPGYLPEPKSAIFIGEVVKKEPLGSDLSGFLGIMRYRVTFKVEYSWKGAGFQEIGLPALAVISEEIVSEPEGLKGCFSSVSFLEGKKYLVYAVNSSDKNLTVGLGNGSKPLWNASDDIKELRRQESFFQFWNR